MMIGKWYKIHRWTSIISGIFFFMLSFTGLILLLASEILKVFPMAKPAVRYAGLLHMNLMSGHVGLGILCVMCFVAILAILSGLYLYKPFSQGIKLGVIRKQTNLSCWKDWHRFLGVVTAAWTIILCVTGIMIGEFTFTRVAYFNDVQATAKMEFVNNTKADYNLSETEVKKLLMEQFPKRKIYRINLEDKTDIPYYLAYISAGEMPKNYLRQVVMIKADYDDKPIVVSKPLPSSMSILGLELHFKNHELMSTRVMWIIFSILTTLMIGAGLYSWYLRKFNKIKRNEQAISIPRGSTSYDGLLIWSINLLTVIGFVWPVIYPTNEIVAAISLGLALLLIFWSYGRHKLAGRK